MMECVYNIYIKLKKCDNQYFHLIMYNTVRLPRNEVSWGTKKIRNTEEFIK